MVLLGHTINIILTTSRKQYNCNEVCHMRTYKFKCLFQTRGPYNIEKENVLSTEVNKYMKT